jgi:amino acid efflux transporter
MGIASANYACDLLGLPGSYTMPIAAFCMLLSVAFCLARLGTTAKVQSVALVALIVGLAVAVALALPSMLAQRLEPFAPDGWPAIGAAIPLVFLSSIGWEGVSAMAEEVRDPGRSFPRAVAIAVPVVGIIYLTVVVAFVALPHTPGALVMPTLLAPGADHHARAIGDVLALLVIVLCTNSNVLCGSRLVVAAAQSGQLPPRLARRAERTGAPAVALLALAGAYVLIFVSALVTGGGALCMLPFTGLALPLAGALTILLALFALGGGLESDRLWALVDTEGGIASGKSTRRFRKVPGSTSPP